MDVKSLTVDRGKALELFRKYKEHQHYSTPVDVEIMRLYELIAKGRMVIQALASIAKAGVGEDGFPKLAIARADQPRQFCTVRSDGSAFMSPTHRDRGAASLWFSWPAGAFPRGKSSWRGEAIVPPAPLHLRPKRGLQNYHILWEADWHNVVPHDPMLLRRVGKGDTWLVLAQWDLSPVERAVLTSRLGQ